MTHAILNIAIDVPLDRLFDYLNNGADVKVGHRVLVQFAHRTQIGVVIGVSDKSDLPLEKLKPILQAFTDEVPIDSETIALIKFTSDYYQYPFGQALLSALPARLRQIAPAISRKQFAYQLTETGLAKTLADIPKRQLVTQRVFSALLLEKPSVRQRLPKFQVLQKKPLSNSFCTIGCNKLKLKKHHVF